jgi:hypothetical protein
MKQNGFFKAAFVGLVATFALVALGCPPPTGGDGSGQDQEAPVNVGAAADKSWLADQSAPYLYAGDGPATTVLGIANWASMETRDSMVSLVERDGEKMLRLDQTYGESTATWVFPQDSSNPSNEGTFDAAETTATVSVDLNIQWYDAPGVIWQYGWFEFFVASGKKVADVSLWTGEAVGGTFIQKFETGASQTSG